MCDTTGHRLLLIGTEITTSEFMKATSLPPHTHTNLYKHFTNTQSCHLWMMAKHILL